MAEDLFNVGEGGPFATQAAQGAPLSITNATLLGYNQDIVYFGSDIGFKKTISLQIRCEATDITNREGVAATSATLLSFLDTSQDYSSLLINGKSMGPARVVSFSSDSADLVNVATCSISFLIHETYDDLSTLSGYYADYGDSLPVTDFGQILNSFTDSISLTRTNNATSYSRRIALAANKSLNILELGDVIREFVRGVLSFGTFSFPNFDAFEADINKLADPASGYKKFITETSDDIANTYNFTESLDAGNIKNGYSLVIKNAYSRNQVGIETVKEEGSILGLTSPRINAAEVGYITELAAASARMTAFYEARRLSSDCPALNTDGSDLLFLVKGKTTNTFEGSIGYDLTANNDPKYKDGKGERWEFTLTVENDGVYETATEQGTVKGAGNVKYDGEGGSNLEVYPMYQTARTFLLATVMPALSSRVSAAINSATFAVSPQPTRRTEAHSPRQGVINYSRSFSNDPIYQKNGGTDNIKKIEASATLGATTPITHEFVSLKPGEQKKIIQQQTTESLSTLQNTITATAYRINPGAGGKTELSRIGDIAKDEINLLDDMDGDTVYMSAANFSFSFLNDVIFTLSPTYKKGVGSCS